MLPLKTARSYRCCAGVKRRERQQATQAMHGEGRGVFRNGGEPRMASGSEKAKGEARARRKVGRRRLRWYHKHDAARRGALFHGMARSSRCYVPSFYRPPKRGSSSE